MLGSNFYIAKLTCLIIATLRSLDMPVDYGLTINRIEAAQPPKFQGQEPQNEWKVCEKNIN